MVMFADVRNGHHIKEDDFNRLIVMTQIPTPSEMRRAKRPYLYSDSSNADAYRLSRSELSHHLDTLTDRNQHKDFEVFARKLCERELRPNLRPMTGPEGGGDGKVDTETYPVDEAVSERWYVGTANKTTGKWAFAFSSKKDWAGKVRSDVQGIVSTGRFYDRIVTITSRPARQKDRLRIEQELEQAHGVPVSIYDREWIIERVFSNDHKELAFEILAVGLHEPDKVKIGPLDFRRQAELDEIEKQLKIPSIDERERTQSVSDAFEAARLSRELERPQTETIGRFTRAIRLARKYGTTPQILRAVYESGWTAFWWFDDVDGMEEVYDEVEAIAFPTGYAAHIDKVCNLHSLLVGRVVRGFDTADNLALPSRSARLTAKLSELVQDKSRPSNALHAETLLILHLLNEKMLAAEGNDIDETWNSLSDILDRARGLGEFPAEMVGSIVDALNEFISDSSAFDVLFESLTDFMAERNQEITAGNMRLSRGKRKLEAELPIDAIKWLGRAVVDFSKEETREEQAESLYLLSVAYKSAGLWWAARATLMASIVQYSALSEKDGDVRIEMIPTLRQLSQISLRLGHVIDAVAAHHFVQSIGRVLPVDEPTIERMKGDEIEFDRVLSCLFINLPPEEISRIERLPDVLETMGLFLARYSLLYRLGYIDELRADGSIPDGTTDDQVRETARFMAEQPVARVLPRRLVIADKVFRSITTKILGVDVTIQSEGDVDGMLYSETYATCLEGFAATLINAGAYPFAESLLIKALRRVDVDEATITEERSGILVASVPAEWDIRDVSSVASLNTHLLVTTGHAIMSMVALRNVETTLGNLVRDEGVFERATLFCRSGFSRNRVFGTHCGRIEDWEHYIKRSYPRKPDAPDRPDVVLPPRSQADEENGAGVFEDLQNHEQIVVNSIIDSKLWDKAEWKGMLYGVTKLGQPPFVGLMFADIDAGREIFRGWIDRFGSVDENEEIRISIIKGVNKDGPSEYRGHITQELDVAKLDPEKRYFQSSRSTTMTPPDLRNVEMFLQHFAASGSYVLVPTRVSAAGQARPQTAGDLELDLGIVKQAFHVRDAWQIGLGDLDAFAIRSTDDVFIPDGQEAPVSELFKWRASVAADTANSHRK